MKLPANVLAKLCLTGVVASAGCETVVDFERRSAPPAKRSTPEVVEVELDRPTPVERTYAQPPPAAAPIFKPTPTPIKVVPKPTPKPKAAPHPKINACGPCGMG